MKSTKLILVVIAAGAALLFAEVECGKTVTDPKKNKEQEDSVKFLLDHISEIETAEEFQKFLKTAPPGLHPSLTDMWMAQRKTKRGSTSTTGRQAKSTSPSPRKMRGAESKHHFKYAVPPEALIDHSYEYPHYGYDY